MITDPNFQTILIIVSIILLYCAKQFLTLIINRFWKRNIETEYVSVKDCKEHRELIKIEIDKELSNIGKETHSILSLMSKNIESINENVQTLNGLVIIAVMKNPDINDNEKQAAVMKLTGKGKS